VVKRGALAGALVALAVAGLAYVATPHDHVAPGCFWWTAKRVGDVTVGDRSRCVRGFIVSGGALAEGTDPSAYRLSFVDGLYNPCTYRPGDAVVFRYDATFDDGRTIIEVTNCR
jgi:hypothetical protein